MSDVDRARRQQVELLQARMKEAIEDLKASHTEGYLEAVQQLTDDTAVAEGKAALREREARAAAHQLDAVRQSVAEAERKVLAPRARASVGPAVVMLTFTGLVACGALVTSLLSGPPTLGGWVVLTMLALMPPPLVAWVWRQRLSEAATLRNPS